MTERILNLNNGRRISSGWIDRDDPDALDSGGYIRVEGTQGEEILYLEASDFAGLTTDEAAKQLHRIITAARTGKDPLTTLSVSG